MGIRIENLITTSVKNANSSPNRRPVAKQTAPLARTGIKIENLFTTSVKGVVPSRRPAVKQIAPPARPLALVIKWVSGAALLSWDPVIVESYNIYYRIDSGEWQVIAKGKTETSYVYNPIEVGVYEFAVSALKAGMMSDKRLSQPYLYDKQHNPDSSLMLNPDETQAYIFDTA